MDSAPDLPTWTETVRTALGIDLRPDLRELLDATRDVAHGVERPAAPVTAFLIGYAAALRGGTEQDVTAVTDEVLALLPSPDADADADADADKP